MHKTFSKYLAILLLFALSLCACQKTPDVGPEPEPREGAWTKVHYRATVSGSAGTKATLDAIDRHYLFERDDLMYVVDSDTHGDKLYGYLYLISGANATEAVFEGDLMYFVETAPGSGKYEPERPANDLAVSATLVSQTQRDAGVYTTVSNNEGKIASGPNFGNRYAATFKEAVQKYSTFTADATYGDPSFHLVQGTAFLLFSLAFEDSVTGSLTLSVTNNSGADNLFSHSFTPNLSTHDASFVAAFQGGAITLTNAKMRVTGEGVDKERALASTTLQGNRYYNVTKTFLNLDYFTIQAREAPTTSISFPPKYQDAAYGLQYSTNGLVWTAVPDTPIDLAAGESIMLRGKGKKYKNDNGSTTLFTSTAPCYIYGDIMSLFCTVSSGDVYTKETAFGGSNNNALDGTFKGMTNLDIHPARPLLLSATTLSNSCYQQMFYGCTGLTRPPEFNNEDGEFATIIPQSACKQMFQGCTALLAAPELPADGTIAYQGYYGMFDGCTSMATPPSRLDVTPTAGDHFRLMFSGCTALLYAPELSTNVVKVDGCRSMFEGCTSLLEAPELPAETVAGDAYYCMFKNCSAMTQGPSVLPATVMNGSCYAYMFQNCSNLEAAPRIDAETLAQNCFREMFSGCGDLRTAQDAFAFVGDIPETACYKMFYQCSALNGAPEMLSVTGNIGTSGCEEMYSECGKIRTVPSRLNATTVGTKGYRRMFYNCDLLINESPAIAATNVGEYGCQEMFRGCSRLKNPPATLPAMTLGSGAYKEMFHSCSALLSAPTLPATIIPASAYEGMFYDCTSMTTPPLSLPGSQLGFKAYYRMFYNCQKLEQIPVFPHEPGEEYTLTPGTSAENGKQDGVCFQMFYKCDALTTLENRQLFNSDTQLVLGCFNDMFSTCANLVTVPLDFLPSTKLGASCYRGMFQSCKKLEQAPNLPAETLVERCYQYMFNTCTSLIYLRCYATNPSSAYSQNWLANAKNTSDCYFYRKGTTAWTRDGNGIPDNWQIINE